MFHDPLPSTLREGQLAVMLQLSWRRSCKKQPMVGMHASPVVLGQSKAPLQKKNMLGM